MDNTQGIHYRTGGKLTHCGCEILPGGKDILYIVIERIEFKETEKIGGKTENNIWVAHFAPNPYTNLPMVLNSTNRKRIAKLYPDCNGYINLLKNIPVRLTKETCRDATDGGETWGLRISKIRASAPKQAPAQAPAQPAQQATQTQKQTLGINNENLFNQALAYIKNGGTIEAIENKYNVTPEAREALLARSKEA